MYCINGDKISLHTFGFDGENNEILNLNGQKAAKIETKKLHEILTSNFKTYKDKSGGNVVFVNGCSLMDIVQMEFLKSISDEYAGISVNRIVIEPQTKLPENFNELKFQNIFLSGQDGSKGVFRVSFEEPDLTSKSLFFKYSFKATMPVFIAINKMDHNHILSLTDYQLGHMEFEKYQKDSLAGFPSSTLVTKARIKAGEVLMNRHFIAVSLVKKGDILNAVLNDGGLSLIIEVKALEDGNLGDIIKIRTKDNKILSASVSGKNQVTLR
ncbi:MAG: flagellar basal body P-ring formation protein FlgA [Campylobacter sp.]|nr:flagellar basal body P-ring formation protein FlgA [Campylobacter sp.]